MKNYTVEELLTISNPCLLFSSSEDVAKSEYKYFVFNYHPDRCDHPKATEALQHILELYVQVLVHIKNGTWNIPGVLDLVDINNKKYRLRYKKEKQFELGKMLISDTVVAYLVDIKYKSLYDNFKAQISNFKYASKEMEKEFKRYLPEIAGTFVTNDQCVIVVKKTPDLLLLSDVLEYYDKAGYPDVWDKHVAWIQSRILNLQCFLKYNNKVHNAICTDTIFISPEYHSIALLGGWFYTVPRKSKMLAVPDKLYNLVPNKVLTSKLSSILTDGEMGKDVCRKALGKYKAPKAFENWLKYGAGKPEKDFDIWQNKILKDSYGERKFIKLELTANEIYTE